MKESTFKKHCLVIDEWLINGFNGTSLKYGNRSYVYALIDSSNNEIFYIGKGKGKRAESHEKEYEKSIISGFKKYIRISKIKDSGNNVIIKVLFNNISNDGALMLERYCINKLKYSLTNYQSGRFTKKEQLQIIAKEELRKLKSFYKLSVIEKRPKWQLDLYSDNVAFLKTLI